MSGVRPIASRVFAQTCIVGTLCEESHEVNMPNIDIHAHWYPREWVAMLEKEGSRIGAKMGRNEKGQVTFALGDYKQKFQDHYIDIPTRLKMMDEARVDIHALSLTSPMIYWAPP